MSVKIIFGFTTEMLHDPYTDADLYNALKRGSTTGSIARWLEGEKGVFTAHTFNPLLVNYLSDAFAKTNVFVEKEGVLNPFSAYPDLVKKLEIMGVGEALTDTHWVKV